MQSGNTPQVKDYFSDLNAPNPQDMQLQLQDLVQQGTLSPEQAQTIMQDPSAMNGITLDPKLKEQQMAALAGLSDISDHGGMTDVDKANLNQIKTDEDTAARGKREAILQNAQSRGMGGSGLELMSQLQNEQDSATRQSQRDLGVAGQAQQRALEALMQGGTLAGNIQNQDFNQQSQVANANDAISRFNAQNSQAQANLNTNARNDAAAKNLAEKQRLADSNTGTQNAQQQYNKNLIQNNFENELKKRSAQAGLATQNANAQGQNSQSQANANNQLVGGLIGVGAAAAGAPGKENGGIVDGDPTSHDSVYQFLKPGEHVVRKEDVPRVMKAVHTKDNGEFDVAGFLDDITGHKYGYSKGNK